MSGKWRCCNVVCSPKSTSGPTQLKLKRLNGRRNEKVHFSGGGGGVRPVPFSSFAMAGSSFVSTTPHFSWRSNELHAHQRLSQTTKDVVLTLRECNETVACTKRTTNKVGPEDPNTNSELRSLLKQEYEYYHISIYIHFFFKLIT